MVETYPTRYQNITFCFITIEIKLAEPASWRKKMIDVSGTAMDMTKKQVRNNAYE
jgi:hypothetical protein